MKKVDYTLRAKQALREINEQEKLNQEKTLNENNKMFLQNLNKNYTSAEQFRKRKLTEIQEQDMFYTEVFQEAVIAIMTDIIDGSLLLDEDFRESNPEYRVDILESLHAVLETAEINKDLENESMLNIFEAVYEETPLFEEVQDKKTKDVAKDVASKAKDKADSDIDKLIKDTKGQVTDTLSKEKQKADEINKDLEKTLQEDYKGFYKEPKEQSLLEMFSINDAKMQIRENDNYNSELALANGIIMITVLEALNITGLVTVNEGKKKHLKDLLSNNK